MAWLGNPLGRCDWKGVAGGGERRHLLDYIAVEGTEHSVVYITLIMQELMTLRLKIS